MRTLAIVTACSLVCAAPASAVSGGETVDFKTVPFVANVGGCTATLIAPDRVLTAAHCLLDKPDPHYFAVVVGAEAHDPSDVPPSAARRVKGYAIAPGFKLAFPFAHKSPQNATAVNDVALIVLAQPVTGIAPVAIAGPGDAALEQPGGAARLLGYGVLAARPGDPFPLPPALQAGALQVISRGQCLKAYPHAVQPTDLCAQDLGPGALTQPCPGDSGGPLLADTPTGPVQIGVTSWGAEVKDKKCGEARLPAVWMRVSAFHDFLTNPNPVLAPHTSVRTASLKRSGRRLTCVAPTFGGSPARVSYRWGIPRVKGQLVPEIPHPLTAIKGATKRTFTTGRAATRGKKVACETRAQNAGGHWTLFS